jgi:hypothetical protein
VLGDHADAIALAEAIDEIFLGPGELEAIAFDIEHLVHVAPDHPADMHSQQFLGIGSHVRLLPWWANRSHAYKAPTAPRQSTSSTSSAGGEGNKWDADEQDEMVA